MKRGAALIIVLWIVTMLGTMTLLYSRETLLSIRIQSHHVASMQAEALAVAGIHRALAVLAFDEPTYDASLEDWYNNEDYFGEVTLGKGLRYQVLAVDPGEDEESVTRYGLVDECAKININTANKAQLLALPEMEEAIVDAIIDWRDDNQTPEPLGAEDEYYGSLAEPYITKNANFDTIEELLLVRDITVTHIFGEDTNRNGILDGNENDGDENEPLDNRDGRLNRGWWPYITIYSSAPNTDAEGEARLNINTAEKDAIKERFGELLNDQNIDAILEARKEGQFNNVGQLLDVRHKNNNKRAVSNDVFKQICDSVTTTDDEEIRGLLNLNTASLTVLKTLYPNRENIAENIVAHRAEEPFDSIAGLLDVDGINQSRFQNVASLVTVRSNVFSVRSTGMVESPMAIRELYAVIDRGASPAEFRLWKVLR